MEKSTFGGENRQIELLENEGVSLEEGRVNLEKYGWRGWSYSHGNKS